jgi:predicted PolB exonuclease-like 3'-5' exonuclease
MSQPWKTHLETISASLKAHELIYLWVNIFTMASSISLCNILFLDIETVPQYPHYDSLPDHSKPFWDLKSNQILKYHLEETIDSIYNRAGIYAEFGKIVCISCGVISGNGTGKKLIIKSFCGDDEKDILIRFVEMLNKWCTGEPKYLCAHNGKEFDFPFLSRRLIVHDLAIPWILNTAGKKPWEVNHLDTMELWKFGDYKSYTSLNLLAHIFDIPTPKDDIDGNQVWHVYWNDKDLPRIVSYCQKDVVTVAQVYLKMQGETFINSENIEIKP